MLPTKFRFIWPSGFAGEDFKKSANQNQELPVEAMFVNRSGQNEHSLERTFHRCFLPSFSSFGWEVSEEKIKMWKVNGRRTPSDGKSSHCLWQGEVKKSSNKTLIFAYLKKYWINNFYGYHQIHRYLIQWNLSILKFFWTNFYVRNRQVFNLYQLF